MIVVVAIVADVIILLVEDYGLEVFFIKPKS